jgi:hypothetical protein
MNLAACSFSHRGLPTINCIHISQSSNTSNSSPPCNLPINHPNLQIQEYTNKLFLVDHMPYAHNIRMFQTLQDRDFSFQRLFTRRPSFNQLARQPLARDHIDSQLHLCMRAFPKIHSLKYIINLVLNLFHQTPNNSPASPSAPTA